MMSFDVTDLTAIEKLLDCYELPTKMDTSGAKYFKNYLEDNEPQKNKSGDYEAFARGKYMGMVLYDAADSAGDDDDESEADYKGEIVGIHFQSKREGGYPKGYYLQTARVLSDGKLDNSEDGKRIYTISEATHTELILAVHNEEWTFLSKE